MFALVMLATPGQALEAAATTAVNVRSGPGSGYPVVDTLHAGEVVDVVECNASETWCRIFHEGPDGWVSRTYLGAASGAGSVGSGIQFGVVIPLPGGGSIMFGTPGYVPPGGGAGAGAGAGGGAARVCVYDLPNYGGAHVCVNAGMSAAEIPAAWDNRVSSLRVHGGASIRLCRHVNYGGTCNIFNADKSVLGSALNNHASSYDVMPPEPDRVCVYDLAHYGGDSVCVGAGTSANNIGAAWNNKVTSLKIFGSAHIRLCQNPAFGGFCNEFTNNVPTLGGSLNNNASSYQTW
jgi:hypothetical protein